MKSAQGKNVILHQGKFAISFYALGFWIEFEKKSREKRWVILGMIRASIIHQE